MLKHKFIVCIGSNTADSAEKIAEACCEISAIVDDFIKSSTYSMPSFTGKGADYNNCVISGHTDKSLDEFTAYTKQIEQRFGRTAESKEAGVMPLDVDIMMWDENIIRPNEFDRPYFMQGLNQIR
jgi:2-amino-4-hydroxy-6-hydroxymethyldihydropteridine diphosphokinase